MNYQQCSMESGATGADRASGILHSAHPQLFSARLYRIFDDIFTNFDINDIEGTTWLEIHLQGNIIQLYTHMDLINKILFPNNPGLFLNWVS